MLCPANPWEKSTTVILNCTIFRQKFPKQCTGGTFADTVYFRNSVDGVATYHNNCTVKPATNEEACSPSSSATCWCDFSNSSQFEYKMRLTATTDSMGYWDCNAPCLDGSNVDTLSHTSFELCDNIYVSSKQFTSLCRHINFNSFPTK
jgi:hypothetical protein